MTRILAALFATVALLVVAPAANADSPYAFAVQPVGCTPGYVHINYSPDADWSLDGDPVEVSAPASEFPFPGGFQGDASATGAESGTYYLTVNAIPSSCYPPVAAPSASTPSVVTSDPTVDLADIIANLKVERMALQAHVSNLERQVRRQGRVIDRLRARIDRLR